MPLDPSYKEQNLASRKRIRALAERLTAEELQTKVGEHWTVSIALAHIAFWDRRTMHILDISEKEGRIVVPQIDVIVNDLSLPLWATVPPREAVRIAIESAEALDKRLEEYSPALLEELYNVNKRFIIRALHRNEHLDEVDTELKQSGG